MENYVKAEQSKTDKRKLWIDFARGLAFVFVIYSHLPTCNPYIMNFLSPVFLTTFFFISGYLYKSGNSFSYILEQRTRTLLLPFLILGFVMICMSQIVSFNDHVPFKDAVKGLLLQNGENVILWFIAALFIYSVGFYFVDKVCTTPIWLLVLSAILFILNSITYHWLGVKFIPWHLATFGFAIFYMALGKLYRLYEKQIDSFLTLPVLAVFLVVYIAAIYFAGRDIYIYIYILLWQQIYC